MIKSLKLKFGSNPNAPAAEFDAAPVTIFVGPNNSGKSKILGEIRQFCAAGQTNAHADILAGLAFEGMSSELSKSLLSKFIVPPAHGETINGEETIFQFRSNRLQLNMVELLAALENPNSNSGRFCSWYLGHHSLTLDGRNRISLTEDQEARDLQLPPVTSFQVLALDNDKRIELRRIIREAFGTFLVVDPTNIGRLRLRLSKRPPVSEQEEMGYHRESVRFHAEALRIADASDGLKAFTGIMSEMIAGDPTVLFVDEPEAFLHPPLAHKLGLEIAKAARQSHKRVFASTHSSQFLMGCIQSGVPVSIVRLTYQSGKGTARILPSDKILALMRNALLRSIGVLSGLFYEFVIVTEGDSDRAFYQEINERLLLNGQDGIPNCLFINAQNKQTIHTILSLLRELGIPAAAIVDIDVLKEGGTVWSSFLKGGNIPASDIEGLGIKRARVQSSFAQTTKDMKRDGGIALLSGAELEGAENLFDFLDAYGLFVVRHGELESWLKNLKATGQKTNWLIQIFEKLGEDPQGSTYVMPGSDDVWEFLRKIRAWLTNSKRKGIPN